MGKTREYMEGNILWQLYQNLGRPQLKEFKDLLDCNNILLVTFMNDTKAARRLDDIPLWRIRVYQSFFPNVNWEEHLKPLAKTQKMQQEEAADKLLHKHGMKRSA